MSPKADLDNSLPQLRVDEAILDYLIFSATHKLIENAKSNLSNDMYTKVEALVELSLEMVDCKIVVNFLSHHLQQGSHRLQLS